MLSYICVLMNVQYKMGVTTSAGNISEYNGPTTSAASAGAGDRDTSSAGKEKLPEDKSPL